MSIEKNVVERAKEIILTTKILSNRRCSHAELQRHTKGTFGLCLRDETSAVSINRPLRVLTSEEEEQIDEICECFNKKNNTTSDLIERAQRAMRLERERYRHITLAFEEGRADVIILVMSDPSDPKDVPESRVRFKHGKPLDDFDKHDYWEMAHFSNGLRYFCEQHND